MYKQYQETIFANYKCSRDYFLNNPSALIGLERLMTNYAVRTIRENIDRLVKDYNEASILYPFWGNYPPEDRGRAPVGDQIPWIEVGEHAIGENISRMMFKLDSMREVGLPSGPDNRFVVCCPEIKKETQITDHAMIFMDIKSVGPRDDAEHIVISHYQASGDGIWESIDSMMTNSPLKATGKHRSHLFCPSMSPIYCLSDGTIAPTIHIFIKPIYDMLNQNPEELGQPLKKIKVICMPNGLLMTCNPGYISTYPELLFPGKDEKSVPDAKKRCRLSFEILSKIAPWRVQVIDIDRDYF